MIPNWSTIYPNAKRLSQDLNMEYRGDGWYLRKDDVLLAVSCKAGICVKVYNNDDPRREMRKLLELPEYNANT